VEGDLAAAVHVDDRGAVERPLVRLGALAGGEHRWVLEQEDLALPARRDLGVHPALEVPRLLVVHAHHVGQRIGVAHAREPIPAACSEGPVEKRPGLSPRSRRMPA
jgi:hypothetical protein